MTKKLTTIGTTTYERLKQDIIFGRFKPGNKLKLGALREYCGASVPILRETLSRLASDGFVSAEEQRGFFVMPISKEDLIEIANLRVLLECRALETSIKNGTSEWEGNLVAAHHQLRRMEEKMLGGDDSEKELWKHYDSKFHLALIEASDSKNLIDLHHTLYSKYLRYQMLVLTYRGAEAVDEHKAMLDAALARDTKSASHLLKTHIINGLNHTLEQL